MPVILLIGLGLIYQLFFRYETDIRDPDGPGRMAAVTYEKDTLTGSIHRLKEGEKLNLLQRLLGTGGDTVDSIPGDPEVTQGSDQFTELPDNTELTQGDIPPESTGQSLGIEDRRRIEPDGQVSTLPGRRRKVDGLRLQPLDTDGPTDVQEDDLGSNWEIPPENSTPNARGFLQGRVSEETARQQLRKQDENNNAVPPVPGLHTQRRIISQGTRERESTTHTHTAPTPFTSHGILPHLSKRFTRNIVAPIGVKSGRLAFHNQPDDLNADGSKEEIIETPTGDGDWVDISVVSGGKEVFSGKGKRLIVLPRRHHGWSDLAISTTDGGAGMVYHYSPQAGTYTQTGLPLPGG